MVAPVSAAGPFTGLPTLYPDPARQSGSAERLTADRGGRDHTGAPQRAPARVDERGPQARFDTTGPGPRPDGFDLRGTRFQSFDPLDDPAFGPQRFDADSFNSSASEGRSDRIRSRPSTAFLAQAIGQELDAEAGTPSAGERDPRSVADLYNRTSAAIDQSLFRGLTPQPGFGDPAP